MREYGTTMLEAKGIDYVFDFPTEAPSFKLPMDVKNNIYLIFKEAVNNLSKYAGCSLCKLSLSFSEKNIYLTIEDNGKGFDEATIIHNGGLNNMRHRAQEIKGVLDIVAIKGYERVY